MYGTKQLAKQRRIRIAQQYFHLKRTCPTGEGNLIKGHCLVWCYETQPTPLSRLYTIRIEYQLDGAPNVFITSPRLDDLSKGRVIPHLYSQSRQQLCLYRPGKGEWSPALFLTETILPWTNLWLYYFEDWLIFGEWKGGGEHPEPKL